MEQPLRIPLWIFRWTTGNETLHLAPFYAKDENHAWQKVQELKQTLGEIQDELLLPCPRGFTTGGKIYAGSI